MKELNWLHYLAKQRPLFQPVYQCRIWGPILSDVLRQTSWHPKRLMQIISLLLSMTSLRSVKSFDIATPRIYNENYIERLRDWAIINASWPSSRIDLLGYRHKLLVHNVNIFKRPIVEPKETEVKADNKLSTEEVAKSQVLFYWTMQNGCCCLDTIKAKYHCLFVQRNSNQCPWSLKNMKSNLISLTLPLSDLFFNFLCSDVVLTYK